MVHAGAPDPSRVRGHIVGSIDTSARVKKVRQSGIRTHTRDIAPPPPDAGKGHGGAADSTAPVRCADFVAKRECLRSTDPLCQWGHHRATGKAAVFEAMPKGRCEPRQPSSGCAVM
eukprot:TRINITY_DN67438_c0_g1_i1.p3 TRINITY_DN67438_c0_g1~~TRINITY_DN67438_c0_g1_i1.p3  ORF type:complete len:116 (+),score=21.11 TRINITY_DN67438_c0_g1_i1:98-445(+)